MKKKKIEMCNDRMCNEKKINEMCNDKMCNRKCAMKKKELNVLWKMWKNCAMKIINSQYQ